MIQRPPGTTNDPTLFTYTTLCRSRRWKNWSGRTNRNLEVRKQAMFWLGQSKDDRALSFIEEILK
jgi:hypothetical protein